MIGLVFMLTFIFFFIIFVPFGCCTVCGKVVEQDIYSNEPSFVKNQAGQVGAIEEVLFKNLFLLVC